MSTMCCALTDVQLWMVKCSVHFISTFRRETNVFLDEDTIYMTFDTSSDNPSAILTHRGDSVAHLRLCTQNDIDKDNCAFADGL